MTDGPLPPIGCTRWRLGESTSNPPEDELFLRKIAEAGFATYVGPVGLLGTENDARDVVVIHRGWGRRWEVTIREAERDVHTAKVTQLPKRVEAAIAWLRGGSLEMVIQLLDKD